jgi:hypothetical protein
MSDLGGGEGRGDEASTVHPCSPVLPPAEGSAYTARRRAHAGEGPARARARPCQPDLGPACRNGPLGD